MTISQSGSSTFLIGSDYWKHQAEEEKQAGPTPWKGPNGDGNVPVVPTPDAKASEKTTENSQVDIKDVKDKCKEKTLQKANKLTQQEAQYLKYADETKYSFDKDCDPSKYQALVKCVRDDIKKGLIPGYELYNDDEIEKSVKFKNGSVVKTTVPIKDILKYLHAQIEDVKRHHKKNIAL